MAVEDTEYNGTPGVKITTKELFEVKGDPWNKFHTGRELIVELLTNKDLRAALKEGKEFEPVYCRKRSPEKGQYAYFVLETYKLAQQ